MRLLGARLAHADDLQTSSQVSTPLLRIGRILIVMIRATTKASGLCNIVACTYRVELCSAQSCQPCQAYIARPLLPDMSCLESRPSSCELPAWTRMIFG